MYSYNVDGLRKSKTINNTETSFVWNNQNMVLETTGNAEKIHEYDILGITKATDGTTPTYYLKNIHGDVTSTRTADGTLVSSYQYDSFGNQLNEVENDNNPFRYTGEYTDTETGLVYLRNRYYNSSVGRFDSEDPILSGNNWYVYAANNPVMLIDPLGLKITLTGSDDEKQKSFNQLQMLTNDELCMDTNSGVVTIVNSGTMNTDKTLSFGSKMVSDLINNDDFNCQIQREYVNNDGCYVDYKNNGAIVRMNDWDEKGGNWGYTVSDGNGGSIWQDHKDVGHILLGHELIHATHHMNGTLADPSRTVYNFTNKGLIADNRYDLNGYKFNISEEYNTVGLPHVVELPNPNGNIDFRRFYLPSSGLLTENLLRTEQGLTNRMAY